MKMRCLSLLDPRTVLSLDLRPECSLHQRHRLMDVPSRDHGPHDVIPEIVDVSQAGPAYPCITIEFEPSDTTLTRLQYLLAPHTLSWFLSCSP